MSRFPSTHLIAVAAVALAVALAAVLALVASGVIGRGAQPAPSGSPKPTLAPVVTPTPAPSDSPAGGIRTVDLAVQTRHSVSVLLDDTTGRLAGAVSGQPGDGMTVRWGDWKVENVDARTLRLVWVGLPRDEVIRLSIAEVDGAYRMELVQSAPPANSDAIGFDRILVLSFDTDVSADDVRVSIKEATA